jgi:hypothetical protein
MIDPIKLEEIQQRARQRVLKAKDAASVATRGRSPEWVQLGTWNTIKRRPDLQARIKQERGEQGWNDYQNAMTELEKRFGGEVNDGTNR